MPESICLQRRCTHQRITRGNIPSTSALKVQDNTKDLETDADEVGSWVLALEHKVIIRQLKSLSAMEGSVEIRFRGGWGDGPAADALLSRSLSLSASASSIPNWGVVSICSHVAWPSPTSL